MKIIHNQPPKIGLCTENANCKIASGYTVSHSSRVLFSRPTCIPNHPAHAAPRAGSPLPSEHDASGTYARVSMHTPKQGRKQAVRRFILMRTHVLYVHVHARTWHGYAIIASADTICPLNSTATDRTTNIIRSRPCCSHTCRSCNELDAH